MNHKTILRLDDATFDREAVADDRPLLLEFGAQWCGPCKALAPLLERIAEEHAAEVRVADTDIDDSPRLAERFGVRGVPTLVVLRGGKEVARHLGVTNRARILGMLQLPAAAVPSPR
jgi:thioredoxin 1